MRRTLKRTLAAIVLISCTAASVAAGPLDDAEAALNQSDFEVARRLLLPLAEQGNPQAQVDLGQM